MKLISVTILALFATQAHANILVVDSSSDLSLTACTAAPADCSLRGALTMPRGLAAVHEIRFNIPMSDPNCVVATGVCTILAATSMPEINPNSNGIVSIDGYTQPGAVPNTQNPDQGGSNAQLKIVLSGNAPSISRAIGFIRHGTVRGLVINGFRDNTGGGSAVSFSSVGSGGVVEGCFIGTDVSGTVAVPNGFGVTTDGNPFGGGTSSSVRVGGTLPAQRNVISGSTAVGIILAGVGHSAVGNLIGTNAAGTTALGNGDGIHLTNGGGFSYAVGGNEPAARNIISGNRSLGILLGFNGPQSSSTLIAGNFIGTDVSGLLPLGNGTNGVQIGSSSSSVGSATATPNVIAFNGTQGVATRNTGGRVINNRIFRNNQLGISSSAGDNGSAGSRSANDVNDADGGANNKQNFADISAFAVAGSNVNLSYRVDSATANSAYPLRVEFYKADGDEGRDLIGVDSYLAIEAQSVKTLSLPIPNGLGVTGENTIVATATDALGNTSEFSFSPLSFTIETPIPSACSRSGERLFCDGFDVPPLPSIEVTVRALSTVFRPNGNVRLSDDRGASCTLTLAPISTPLTSAASCVLGGSGAPGPITITAVYDTFSGAFGSDTGGNITVTQNFTL
ncbi:MAG: hypothetical protein LH481_12485 [Burkholderiales bacterium]|nr:hypothetical protein [Burkholderiales bacterium]